jgi:hypothetical protein
MPGAQPWTDVIDVLRAAQPAPSSTIVVAAAALAAVSVVYRPAWVLLRHVVTIAHEGGHAAVAVLAGRRLRGVRLHSDTSGVTVTHGRPTGIGVVLVLLAGYLAPSLIGLVAAFALSRGYVVALLWLVLALLALLLLQIRNVFGVVSVVVTGAAVFAVSWWAPMQWQGAAAYVLVWFLLLSGPMPVLELQAQRSRRRAPTSDADQLAGLTRVPGIVWVGVFLLGTVSAAVLGGWWLLPL